VNQFTKAEKSYGEASRNGGNIPFAWCSGLIGPSLKIPAMTVLVRRWTGKVLINVSFWPATRQAAQ
jgi:hypothetical protein